MKNILKFLNKARPPEKEKATLEEIISGIDEDRWDLSLDLIDTCSTAVSSIGESVAKLKHLEGIQPYLLLHQLIISSNKTFEMVCKIIAQPIISDSLDDDKGKLQTDMIAAAVIVKELCADKGLEVSVCYTDCSLCISTAKIIQ